MPARIDVMPHHLARAHRHLRVAMPFDVAMQDRAMSICIRAVAERFARTPTSTAKPDAQRAAAADISDLD